MSQASFPMVPMNSLEAAILPILLSIHGPGMHGILSLLTFQGPKISRAERKASLVRIWNTIKQINKIYLNIQNKF